MAKVKFSALISDMRNKLNGSVFSKNRAGSYLRNKVTPVNPQSVAQTAARSKLTDFSQTWRTLTEDQRNAWNGAVSQWATTDIFGDIKNPTGLQLYIRLNINISNAGGTPITLPPNPTGVEPVLDMSLDAEATPQVFAISDLVFPTPAGMALYVEATPGLSPGISNANSQFRFIAVLPPASADGDLIAAYTAKFGTVVAGKKYFVRAKYMNIATGQVSQPLVAQTIAIA